MNGSIASIVNLGVCKSDLLTILRKTYLCTAGLSASEAPAEGFGRSIPEGPFWPLHQVKERPIWPLP